MSRRGENIYKRRDGRWEARYIYAKDLNGKAKYKYLYGKTYREAKEKLCNLISNNTNISKSTSSKNLNYFCNMWLEEVKVQLKFSTYVKYYNIVNNHILPAMGYCKIQFIDTMFVKKFINEKLTSGKIKGDGLSPKTVKDILSVFRIVINYASNFGINSNINFNIINIKSKESEIKVLSKNQRNKLSLYLINNMNFTTLGILICLYTGIRIGEVCALKFEDISLSDKIVHIKKTVQRIQNFNATATQKTSVIITLPKSQKSIRDIPLPDIIVNIIKENFDCSPDAFLLSGNASFVEPRTLENRFNSIIKKCEIKNVNFHSLRHTFATHCVEVGFDLKSLSEILGHSSVNITLNRYVHSSLQLKEKNMAKLNFMPSIL